MQQSGLKSHGYEFAINVETASHNNTAPCDNFIFVIPIKATENKTDTLQIIFSLWELDSKTLWCILQDLTLAVLALYLDTCIEVIPLSFKKCLSIPSNCHYRH